MKKKFAIVLALFLIAVVCSAGCIDPETPVDPVVPMDPVAPVDPVTPVDPVVPEDPEEPVDPVVPAEGDFTVTFMMNSAVDSGVYLTVYVDEGKTVAEPAVPEKPKAQYIFVQWTTDKENRHAYDFTTPVTADLVLYADWDVKGTSSGSSSSGSSSSGNQHIEHNYEFVKTVNPTCTEGGYDLYKCSCGAEEKRIVVSATGHTKAFKTEDGKNIIYCSVCSAVLESENVPSYVAQIGNNFYETLDAANAAANNDDTIKLLNSATGTITKPVIIEVNGQTATLTYNDGNHVKIMGSADVSLDNGMLVTLEVDAEGYNVTKSATDRTANLWIYTVNGLKDFRDAVNAGTSYSGWTVTLMNNIDLKNEEWTPIGSGGKTFNGVFDGQRHIISNLNVKGAEKVGFFGSLYGGSGVKAEIKDLIVRDATITGNHHGGVIAGSGGSGKITNCQVYDSTVTLTPVKSGEKWDDGDKAGGIVGFMSDGHGNVEGCTVSNVEVSGYRDIGGIVGAATGQSSSPSITGNTVKDTIIMLTNSECEDSYSDGSPSSNAGVFVGRIAGVSPERVTVSDNTYENVIYENYVKYENGGVISVSSLADSTLVELAAGEYTLSGAFSSYPDVTFIGAGKDKTTINLGTSINSYGGDLVFENLKLVRPAGFGYHGFQHTSSETYNNCAIEGEYVLYAKAVFTDCTFTNTGDNYNVRTYGSQDTTFNNCIFNSDGKALLVYGDDSIEKVMINKCIFNDLGTSDVNKAAIEIGSDKGDLDYITVTITETTVNGFEVTDQKTNAEGKTLGGDSLGTNVWGNKNLMDHDHLNVLIDGVDVY